MNQFTKGSFSPGWFDLRTLNEWCLSVNPTRIVQNLPAMHNSSQGRTGQRWYVLKTLMIYIYKLIIPYVPRKSLKDVLRLTCRCKKTVRCLNLEVARLVLAIARAFIASIRQRPAPVMKLAEYIYSHFNRYAWFQFGRHDNTSSSYSNIHTCTGNSQNWSEFSIRTEHIPRPYWSQLNDITWQWFQSSWKTE